MLTQKMSGIFDCRAYDQSGKLTHDQRKMLADTDNITFSALIPIDQVPDMFKPDVEHKLGKTLAQVNSETNNQKGDPCRITSSKAEKAKAKAENREPVADVVAVKFKIGANAKWFDKFAKPCARPTNAELEANRYNVQIDFTRKAKDPSNPLKPSGYWVNNIMISPIESNPFSGQAFEEGGDDDTDPDASPKDGALPGALAVPGAQAQAATAPKANQVGTNEEGDDLPF